MLIAGAVLAACAGQSCDRLPIVTDLAGDADDQVLDYRPGDPNADDNSATITAHGGGDLSVQEGEQVVLDGSASSSTKSDALTFAWTQTAGPTVELAGSAESTASFAAPAVEADTALAFRLTVDDGSSTASDEVNVLVLNQPVMLPELRIEADPPEGQIPLTVALAVVSQDGSPLPDMDCAWDFGDGSSGTGPEVTHEFRRVGTFTVSVCATVSSVDETATGCAEAAVVASLRSTGDGSGDDSSGGGGGGGGSSPPPPPPPPPPPDDEAPTVYAGMVTTDEDTDVTVTLQGSDPEGADLTFEVVSPPQYGELRELDNADVSSASVVYRPLGGFRGFDLFSFRASDGTNDSAAATVSLAVGRQLSEWPLKTGRVLVTDEQITAARQLCQEDYNAGLTLRSFEETAAYWLGFSDQELRDLLPDSRVPRAFNVSSAGCPVHGTAIYQYGNYPWILDPDQPFVVTCPIGGEQYPSNDFRAYYEGGMSDPGLLTGPYADDGRGWVSPDDDTKYWFVAYACRHNWLHVWLPAVTTLSRAYIISGNPVYARKAIVMLDRIADVYPAMDYSTQSRLGEMKENGHAGKILDRISEAGTLRDLAIAYDMVFDQLMGPEAISLPWRTAAEIRANIEVNLLEEGIAAVGRGQILGNYGAHQAALAYAAVVRQNGPTSELVDGIFTATGGDVGQEGLNYALYNLTFKDGIPYETSPFYGFTWLTSFARMAEPLGFEGTDLYAIPKMQKIFDHPLDILVAGQFTPNIGDAGDIEDRLIGPKRLAYESSYRHLGDPGHAWVLDQIGELRVPTATSYDDLLKGSWLDQAQADAAAYEPIITSRFLDGFGLAILNNAAGSVGVSLFYGPRGTHGHHDRLNVELFGHDYRMAPDLGYPDFANGYISGIYSWTANTISHNTVMVDEAKQWGNVRGQMRRFHDAPTVSVVDVDAVGSYEQSDVYRRTLVLVDAGGDDAYLVDVFRVRGGTDHVMSLHGYEGDFALQGATLPAPVTQGTLAGSNVAYGELYDDPILGAPDYDGLYTTYGGSGYQHLFNWQAVVPDAPVTGVWSFNEGLPAQLRVHVPRRTGQEVVVADAYVSPLQTVDTTLKYMLLRRTAWPEGSTFVVVWEPNRGTALIDQVVRHEDPALGSGADEAILLSVHRGDTVDTVFVAPEAGLGYTVNQALPIGDTITTDAAVAVVSSEADGTWSRAFAAGGSQFAVADPAGQINVPATVTGTMTSCNPTARGMAVNVGTVPPNLNELIGRTVRIHNPDHSSVYVIKSVSSPSGGFIGLWLTGAEAFTGRVQIQSVNEADRIVVTNTTLPFPESLVGMTLFTEDLSHRGRIASVSEDGEIQVVPGVDVSPFAEGLDAPGAKDAWIADFGPGDEVEIEMSAYLGS